jgi:aerobic-type carbon monoxide dehydrogenase small subunit (CoxS/CutS family)
MMMASAALLKVNPSPDEQEIREGLAGNICRCTGYDKIVDSVQMASGRILAEKGRDS